MNLCWWRAKICKNWWLCVKAIAMGHFFETQCINYNNNDGVLKRNTVCKVCTMWRTVCIVYIIRCCQFPLVRHFHVVSNVAQIHFHMHTQTTESTWWQLKRNLPQINSCHDSGLLLMLGEYMYRWRYRGDRHLADKPTRWHQVHRPTEALAWRIKRQSLSLIML